MAVLTFEYREGGLWFPHLGLWLDAPRAQGVGVPVFVSHAHSDHTARHVEVIASPATAAFMEARLGRRRGQRGQTLRLGWDQERRFTTSLGVEWGLTLLPAGHIWGSAMALLRAGDESLLYTGDFKLTPSMAAERCEPRRARYLIMESTFGRPAYVFPSRDDLSRDLIAFCEQALAEGRYPVLQGYALGKAQELAVLALRAGLRVALHPRAARMMDVYREQGGPVPPGDLQEAPVTTPCVLVCPPGAEWKSMIPAGAEVRVAVATGWALDRGARFRYRADVAFPMSDHADYPQLIRMVETVSPERIFTLHGFSAEFACRLRELGWDAMALSEPDQLEFRWGAAGIG